MRPPQNNNPQAPAVHVNLARASTVFEWAALEQIMDANEQKDTREKKKRAENACHLLIMGIRQDSYYKRRNGGAPSVRLFDLLGTIMCRCGLKDQFQTEFDQLIQEADKYFKNGGGSYESKKRRVHIFSHTRFKPGDFKSTDAPAPDRLWDKGQWKQQQEQWKTREQGGPTKKKSPSPNVLGPADAKERAIRRQRAWDLRKTKWLLVNCGSRLLDPNRRVTWRLPFWPESLMKRHEELSKLNAEQQRVRRRLNIPLDIPAIEIPFLPQ